METQRPLASAFFLALALAASPSFAVDGPQQPGDSGGSGLHHDANGDGRITRSEWRGSDAEFRDRDDNRDGVLTGREMAGIDDWDDDDRYDDDRDGDRWDGRWDEGDRADRFDRLDRNGDGRISRGEWTGDRDAFDRLDHNDDAYVTRAEFYDPSRGQIPDDRFYELDRNRDGRLSRGEWPRGSEGFDRLDRDDDGYVAWSEFLDLGVDDRRLDRFRSLDVNRDGRLSRYELPRGDDRARFDRADANRDGYLSPVEFLDRYGRDDRDDRDVRGDDFRDLDTNRDGRISRAEWPRRWQGFDRLDTNDDGYLSRRELLESSARDDAPYRRFYALDDDRDGRLSRREWSGDRDDFARMDRNRDGYLSLDEYLRR